MSNEQNFILADFQQISGQISTPPENSWGGGVLSENFVIFYFYTLCGFNHDEIEKIVSPNCFLYSVEKSCWIFWSLFVCFQQFLTKVENHQKSIFGLFGHIYLKFWDNIFFMIFLAHVQNIWRTRTLTLGFGT